MTEDPAPQRCWVGQRPLDGDALPSAPTRLVSAVRLPAGREGWSLESKLGRRKVWSNSSIEEVLNAWIADGGLADPATTWVPYRSVVAPPGVPLSRLACPPIALFEALDDNLVATELLDAAKVPMPAFVTSENRDALERASEWLHHDGRVVVKQPTSASGSGCRVVSTEHELRDYILLWPRCLITRFVEGLTFNSHVVVDPRGVSHAGWCSLQLAGVAAIGAGPLVYAGNELSASQVPDSLRRSLRDLGDSVGRAIARLGYLGMAGFDAIVTPDGPALLVDLNPRFQGSSLLVAQWSSIENSTAPGDHLFAAIPNRAPEYKHTAAQLLLRNRSALRYQGGFDPGRYRIHRDSLQRVGDASHLCDVRADEIWVLDELPEPGTDVDAGATLGRVFFPRRVTNEQGGLTTDAEETCLALLQAVGAQ